MEHKKIDPICGMEVNESSALKAEKDGKTYFFCSRHCLNKFAEKNNIAKDTSAACLSCKKTGFYRNKTFIVSGILIAVCALSYLLPVLEPLRRSLFMYFKIIWWAVLLGFFLGGIIDHFIPREYISHILAKPKKRTIIYSVLLGFLMSACSRGILAN